jgi:hypothetical protein
MTVDMTPPKRLVRRTKRFLARFGIAFGDGDGGLDGHGADIGVLAWPGDLVQELPNGLKGSRNRNPTLHGVVLPKPA